MRRDVLLIEDEPHIAEAIRYILARDGWEVAAHADGASAMAAIHSCNPLLVILDVMLPGRSGFDILKDMRDDPATRAIPVLMLTARSQLKDRELAERLGASRFVAKPFSNADMLAAVRDLAGG
ncbi:response regulator [Haematobacter massiliensis]|uniref:Chemotaxis protein CheY n=2 Tax=Haematobacter massiliensis TaxID=195105 RepID=A0A086YB08_9RHOB|nr:response regulator [Haematobacter massiliensis]KFI31458.1 chemotaxis protein CheY [Haematobacter massiliensis]OWJ71641.1 response regulator [Haematobacter massiliensis]OWJ88079.1 response regulator [Haematobacter massiliensis]QBJ23539.1 response regulator [Haematobacter massiliensis]